MIRQIQQALLSQFQHDERESERLWYGHMRDMNPDAMKEHHRQKLIDTVWNIVAFFVVVIGGSAILRTMP